MAIIKCKMCGGDIELAADKTFGTCEFCGSTMTFPKVDDEQRAAAFNRGNHFRRIGEFDKALEIYEQIVREDDTDAEAHWCCALCRFGIEYVEDPATLEYLPTCHRASFDSFLEDVDYLAAVEHSEGITRRQYQKDAAKIAEVQRGILATSQNAEPFDVFICYKESDEKGDRTRDSLLAQDIYYQLTEQGRKVFFARITLEDVAGTQYEPYIFAALNSAKVMIVVGTNAEHLNAVWVKNEWSRFLAMMKKDRHKLLLPCYRDMDPYDMPEQLSVLQSYDMSKIGFIQDLLRGISKVLDADKKPETVVVQETVVQQAAAANYQALLKRGSMALEDKDWARADEFFEEVLNQDAECAEAYVGKALAAAQCSDLTALARYYFEEIQREEFAEHLSIPENETRIATAVSSHATPGFLEASDIRAAYQYDLGYRGYLKARTQLKPKSLQAWKDNKNLTRATRFATGSQAAALTAALAQLTEKLDSWIAQAKEQQEQAHSRKAALYAAFLDHADRTTLEKAEAAKANRESLYRQQEQIANESTDPRQLNDAAAKLESLGDYKDSKVLVTLCREKISEILAREEAEKQAARKAEAEAAARKAERQRIDTRIELERTLGEKEATLLELQLDKKKLGTYKAFTFATWVLTLLTFLVLPLTASSMELSAGASAILLLLGLLAIVVCCVAGMSTWSKLWRKYSKYRTGGFVRNLFSRPERFVKEYLDDAIRQTETVIASLRGRLNK